MENVDGERLRVRLGAGGWLRLGALRCRGAECKPSAAQTPVPVAACQRHAWHQRPPKLQFVDSGLLVALLDLGAEEVQLDRTRFGNVLETFVFAELLKHTTTAEGDYRLLHYRDADQVEVDVVLENAAGQLVGVEVKAAATVKPSDLRGLKKLASLAGSQFKLGVLLYDGAETLPLGDGIWAVPMSTLWGA